MSDDVVNILSGTVDVNPVALKYADVEVPRYTSYPTALQFSDSVGEEQYRTWLAVLPPDRSLSLYVHIPFCQTLCWYCGCHTTIVHSYDRVGEYFRSLTRELHLLSEALPAARTLSHLHFGGGTPTILSDEDFVSFMDAVRKRFTVHQDTEIAVEIDPRTLNRQKAKALSEAGVTRASLGVQELSPQVQEKINRLQPFDVVADGVGWLRDAGILKVNFDLMYGLPGQSEGDIVSTIDQCATLSPDRFAVFGYAHVPWFKKHQQVFNSADLPETDARLRQVQMAADALQSHGYLKIGFDHFAKPGDSLAVAAHNGTMRRNFQGYTTDTADALLGLGASSIGALPQAYVQNAPRLDDYRDAVAAGRLPVTRGVIVSDEDRLRRAAIERLMCDFKLDAGALCGRFGVPEDQLDDASPKLSELEKDGLVRMNGRRVEATEAGRLFIRNIAACFDAYWSPSPARHSRAV